MKHILSSVRITFFLMLVLGIAYPLLVTLLSQLTFAQKANGSLVYENGQLRGSELISQNFEKPIYFWSRPSAVSFNPLPSGGSNLGPTSKALQDAVRERNERLRAAHPGAGHPPGHLLFASGSGLDPHQSVDAIRYQMPRVAKARGLSPNELEKLVSSSIEPRQLGILGEEVVNVLALNRVLDQMQEPAPQDTDAAQPPHPSKSSGE